MVCRCCAMSADTPRRRSLRRTSTVRRKRRKLGGGFRSLRVLSKGCQSQSKPGTVPKMVNPGPCKELRRRKSATISGWDCPLLTFIYPGFEHVAHVGTPRINHPLWLPLRKSSGSFPHSLLTTSKERFIGHKKALGRRKGCGCL